MDTQQLRIVEIKIRYVRFQFWYKAKILLHFRVTDAIDFSFLWAFTYDVAKKNTVANSIYSEEFQYQKNMSILNKISITWDNQNRLQSFTAVRNIELSVA